MGGQLHEMCVVGGSCRRCGTALVIAGDGRGRAICGTCLRAVDADIALKRAVLLPAERAADVLTALA